MTTVDIHIAKDLLHELIKYATSGEEANRRLSKHARAVITDAAQVFVSSASLWKLAIKTGINKIRVDLDEVAAALSTNGFDALEISNAHALKVAQLPPIHREPFDRMLVAQAMCEPLKLLTADSFLADYSALVEVI